MDADDFFVLMKGLITIRFEMREKYGLDEDLCWGNYCSHCSGWEIIDKIDDKYYKTSYYFEVISGDAREYRYHANDLIPGIYAKEICEMMMNDGWSFTSNKQD